MIIKFDPDDGSRLTEEATEVVSTAAPLPVTFSDLGRQRIESLLLEAMSGTMNPGRALAVWEPKKLHARHIAILMDRAAGRTTKELELKFRMTTVHINNILRHPYSLQLLSAMQAANADKMTDVSARLQGYANEMLNVKLEVLRTTKDNRLKDSIASDMLDRAGYGPRRQVDVNAGFRFALPQSMAEALGSALSESDKIGDVDYSQFTGKRLGSSATALEGVEAVDARPVDSVVAEPNQDTGASPGNSPAELRKTA